MKTSMPLPLELTKPVALASDLDTLLVEKLDIENTRYNPETQTRAPQMWGGGRRHNTSSKCNNYGLIQIDDVLQDFSV